MAYPFHIATYYNITSSVNDVIFPSGCEARAFNLGNKNMKIAIFTGHTSVRLKNTFTDISRYPTGKHEIKKRVVGYQHFLLLYIVSSQLFESFCQPKPPNC